MMGLGKPVTPASNMAIFGINSLAFWCNPGGDNLAGSIFHVHPRKLIWTPENRPFDPKRNCQPPFLRDCKDG